MRKSAFLPSHHCRLTVSCRAATTTSRLGLAHEVTGDRGFQVEDRFHTQILPPNSGWSNAQSKSAASQLRSAGAVVLLVHNFTNFQFSEFRRVRETHQLSISDIMVRFTHPTAGKPISPNHHDALYGGHCPDLELGQSALNRNPPSASGDRRRR